jgi:hypothetical protein
VYPVKKSPDEVAAKEADHGEDCTDEKLIAESYMNLEERKDENLREHSDNITYRYVRAGLDQGH